MVIGQRYRGTLRRLHLGTCRRALRQFSQRFRVAWVPTWIVCGLAIGIAMACEAGRRRAGADCSARYPRPERRARGDQALAAFGDRSTRDVGRAQSVYDRKPTSKRRRSQQGHSPSRERIGYVRPAALRYRRWDGRLEGPVPFCSTGRVNWKTAPRGSFALAHGRPPREPQ